MKLLIKLALVGLIVNGAYHVGAAYWTHYSFRDDVQDLVQYRAGNKDDTWVREQILGLAQQYEIPVEEKAIEIQSERLHKLVTISYVRKIDIFPGVKREWPFTANVDALGLK